MSIADREAAAPHDPLRNAYFGELHLHTSYSLDAYIFGNTMNDPFVAYRFARGGEVTLANGARKRIKVPLDFAAITDHGEALGEYEICTNPEMDGYDSETCKGIRANDMAPFNEIFAGAAKTPAVRLKDICGEDGSKCRNAVPGPWQRIQQAAEDASVWRTIAQITVSHLDTAMSLVAGLSTGDGRARVAMALHRLASLDGVTGTNSAVVSVSQQELGAMTRLSRNAIRPVIAELEKAGLAIPRYRRIVIPDLAALARFAAAASPDRTGAAR